ncbi:MAG: DUF885 domain-containing protein [bacterium]|nr:DUF885 domain-containing protein [bacterium]
MGRRINIALTILALTLVMAGSSEAAKRNKQTFDKLAGEVLETLQAFYPVLATEKGVHSYDHRLTDYSSKSVKEMIKQLDRYVKELHKYRNMEFDTADRINYQLIRSNVEIAILDLKQIKWHRKLPQVYVDDALHGVYLLMVSGHAPMSERLYSIMARMKAVPALFATARRNVQGPPDIYVEVAQETLESTIEFYRQVSGELAHQFPERADDLLETSTKAREAMHEFSVYLTDIPRGPGTSFSIGRQDFDYKLKHEYFLDFDADSLLRIGESLLAEADSAYREYQEYVENNHQNGKEAVFIPSSFNRQDILDYYQWETDKVREFLERHDIVSVPEDIADLKVIETPPFLRSMVAGIAYHAAGPFDQNQTGYFYVRPIPEDLDSAQLAARYRYVHRRGFKGSVVHEGYPGHHLQTQLAGRHEHPVRKWQSNTMMQEGWALYSEEMIYHAGLFGAEDPARWLAVLGGIRYRAARIIADVKLHTGQFTYAECLDWMTRVLDAETEADKNYHRRIIRKYTMTPTVWMSYLMGKREIERLRDAAIERDGDAFVERDFYDDLLAEGSIPPALMWKIMGLK